MTDYVITDGTNRKLGKVGNEEYITLDELKILLGIKTQTPR